MKKKIHNLIDLLFLLLPFILICLSVNRLGAFDMSIIESGFADFRNFDFGLSDYLLTNFFNNSDNVYLLFTFDLMIYFFIWRLLDLVYSILGFFIDIFNNLVRKFGGAS